MFTHWDTVATLAAQHQHELRSAADRRRQAAAGRLRARRRRRPG
jgi:hypothetical protein